MSSVAIKTEASSPQLSPLPDMTSVDIKVEPSSPPPILPLVSDDIMDVDIKLEPSSSPPSMLPPGMVGVYIKAEPSSPPPALRLVSDSMRGFDIKVEPSSPPSELLVNYGTASVDIKAEPSSPSPALLPVLDANNEGPIGAEGGSNDSATSTGITDSSIGRTLVPRRRDRSLKEPHVCPVCDFKCPTKSRLTAHTLIHSGEMPFRCEVCPAKFASKQGLDGHGKVHASGVYLFHCPECGKTFKRRRGLTKHQRWHRREKPYPCHLCPARFMSRHTLENHVLRHTCAKAFTCPLCKSRFSWEKSLGNHIRKKHSGVQAAMANADSSVDTATPSTPLTAPPLALGGTKYTGPADAVSSRNSNETSRDIVGSVTGTCQGVPESSSKKPERRVGTNSHKCGKCGQRFGMEEYFKRHRHQCQAKPTCSHCGKSFTVRKSLVLHQLVQTGEEPRACPTCGRKFATESCLAHHQRAHKHEKAPSDKQWELRGSEAGMFSCSECDMEFREMAALQRHIGWHKAETTHQCHLCPARFARLCSLKDHLLRHTCETPFVCHVCKEAFSWRNTLSRHIHETHGGVKTAVANINGDVEAVMSNNPLVTVPPVNNM